jgi:hypothetical protein
MPLLAILSKAIAAGALGGVCVLSPLILMAVAESSPAAIAWTLAGALSGAVTAAIISVIYRLGIKARRAIGDAASVGVGKCGDG